MYFETQDGKLGGIFDYLYSKYSANYKKYVITDQSLYLYNYHANAEVIVKTNEGSGKIDNYASANLEYSNFSIALPLHKIKLTSYTFQSRNDVGNGIHFPISWVLEATNDFIIWKKIATVSASGFNNYNQYKTFSVNSDIAYKGFRFTMQGKDYSGSYSFFILHRIEFFGYLYRSENNKFTKARQCSSKINILLSALMLS